MRILYITTIGKTMGFFKTLIKDLILQGNVVDIATNDRTSKVPACYYEFGCHIYTISTSRSLFNFGNIVAIKQIKKIAANYDIIHCHTPIAAVITRLACRTLRKKGLKVVYTAHGFHFYKGAPKKNWALYYPIEKLCSKWTDVLITINQEDYELALKRLKSKSVYYVHGVGINVDLCKNARNKREELLSELNIPIDSKILVSVGELNKNKNHKIIIQALRRINDSSIHYLIAGEGNQKEFLINLAKESNVNLHLLGYRDDIYEIYKSSDICLFPSIREGLGLAALEGYAAGLPVICSENRGTRELKELGVIMCKFDDPDSFCKAIKTSLLRQNNKALSNSIYEFDVKSINAKMFSIYSNLINQ